jgi:hypothetical protein
MQRPKEKTFSISGATGKRFAAWLTYLLMAPRWIAHLAQSMNRPRRAYRQN